MGNTLFFGPTHAKLTTEYHEKSSLAFKGIGAAMLATYWYFATRAFKCLPICNGCWKFGRSAGRATEMAKILLADDELATRDLVSRALEMDGHKVIAAQEGAEALEKISSGEQFDLLVTDVQMPVMDGITLISKVTELAPGLRIILMSGYAEQLQRAEQLAAGPMRSVMKPFTLEQIRAEVRTVLSS